jgi:ketosteroid isomerase-like protein
MMAAPMRNRIAAAALTATMLAIACGTPAERQPPTPPSAPSATAAASASTPASAEPASSASSASSSPPTPAKPLAILELESLDVVSRAMNQHDAQAYVSVFTSNAIHKEASAPDVLGTNEMAQRMRLLFDSFSDLAFSFDQVFQKDNLIVATWRWAGTDTGGFLSKKPTGRRAGVEGVTVAFFNFDGHVREVHLYEDGMTAVSQLDARVSKDTYRAPPDVAGPKPPQVIAGNAGPGGGADDAKNLASARAFYDALEDKSEPKLTALFNDDAIVEDFASTTKTAKGAAAFQPVLKGWTTAFGNFKELPLYNLLAVGSFTIAERVMKSAPGADGKQLSLHCLDIIEWRAGKIAHLSTWSNKLEIVHR